MRFHAACLFLLLTALPAVAENGGRADWPSAGGPLGGGQYAPLDQITIGNVAKLKPAWTYRTGEPTLTESPGGVANFAGVPLHVNDTVYLCTPQGKVIALEPATGTPRWVFDPTQPPIGVPPHAGICRGVAYWSAPPETSDQICRRRIFRGDSTTGGSFLYAVDADTGNACPDFGAGQGRSGSVSLDQLDWRGKTGPFAVYGAPMVIGDLVILGTSVVDNATAVSRDGTVRALDARTGEERWVFYAIPEEMRDKTGAANVWAPFSVDEKNGLVVVPTSSPSPDLYGGDRLDEMPYANAIVALEASSGRVVWSYQTIRHDIFDFDLPAQPILTELDGREVVVQIAKTGFTFVLDRKTGEPVFPVRDMPAPVSDVPGERSAPTQPAPSTPKPFARQTFTRDEVFGLTPLDRWFCRRQFDEARYDGLFTPPSLKGSIMFPSLIGGGNWGGAALDPDRGILIAKSSNLANYVRLVPKQPGEDENPPQRRFDHVIDYLTNAQMRGAPYRSEGGTFLSPLGVPCTPPPWGTLTALDLRSGEILWQIPLGQSKKFGITVPAFLGWGSPNIGGPLLTGGGVIFIGATLDAKLRAIDASSGRELWQAALPAPAMSVPITYMADGRQFVITTAGGHYLADTEISDAVVAFALPR